MSDCAKLSVKYVCSCGKGMAIAPLDEYTAADVARAQQDRAIADAARRLVHEVEQMFPTFRASVAVELPIAYWRDLLALIPPDAEESERQP